jgi:hypothetical protein
MTLKEYSNKIRNLARKFPDAEVVYASDEEGNTFTKLYYEPTVGIFKDNGFYGTKDPKVVNAVCIN